jgi:hypothetical protein
MKKFLIIAVIIVVVVGAILIMSGSKKSKEGTVNNNSYQNTNTVKGGGASNVCSYFPKELIESATGKSIVKVESPFSDNKTCFYYTFYSETYNHTPYGDNPGGTQVVAVYDDKDLAKDKISNEKSGSVYGSDASIGMDNYVVRNSAGKIWQTVLILGGEKYIRIHFIQDAVTGDDLVKIAAKFAEKIKSGK